MDTKEPPKEEKDVVLNEQEKQSLIQSVKEEVRQEVKREVSATITKDIRTDVIKSCAKWYVFIVPAVTAAIGFWIGIQITLPQIYRKAEQYITESITKKFSEPNISKTLQDVASQEAQSIIASEVRPGVEKAKEQIVAFETYLDDMELKFDAKYKILAEQVSNLEERDKLMQLADEAINNGNRQAYEGLMRIANDSFQDENIRFAAKAEWFQVKRFYIGLTRVKGRNLAKRQSDGTKIDVKDEDLTTQELVRSLLASNEWTVRVLAASALKNRKEKGVPEALLHAARNDQKLDVVKEAIDSFEAVTGYTSSDVFGYESAELWWEQNRQDVESQLKPREKSNDQGDS